LLPRLGVCLACRLRQAKKSRFSAQRGGYGSYYSRPTAQAFYQMYFPALRFLIPDINAEGPKTPPRTFPSPFPRRFPRPEVLSMFPGLPTSSTPLFRRARGFPPRLLRPIRCMSGCAAAMVWLLGHWIFRGPGGTPLVRPTTRPAFSLPFPTPLGDDSPPAGPPVGGGGAARPGPFSTPPLPLPSRAGRVGGVRGAPWAKERGGGRKRLRERNFELVAGRFLCPFRPFIPGIRGGKNGRANPILLLTPGAFGPVGRE